ncbi:MAG: L-seryl-tRNA(Sec) selenium transferase [Polyangiaceae bacterium]|nr:L-seryl-tRNA(Sec) selenium transferase [Polyangiaceae bacterium]
MPRVDRVVARPDLAEVRAAVGPKAFVELVRAGIDAARTALLSGERRGVPTEEEVATWVRERAGVLRAGRARRVINATGVMLHTNLGRAPLSERAAAAVAESMRGYSSIELDLGTGKRGKRAAFLEASLASLAGAEAAIVVNNCAAAVLLLLAAVARGRSVVVSRGELVEIGGGFRVPDVMVESGARLIEVGTTNKTRRADYERALDANPDCAAILRVHQGNFRQLGFVERPSLAELGDLARERGIPLLKDLGGGALVDLSSTGFVGEPIVASCVRDGCAAVTFSADKVLGGPQGGAIVGSSAIIERVRKHPLARALRLGRLAIVALEATLEAYLLERAWEEVPALAMSRTSVTELEARVDRWVERFAAVGISARRVATEAEMGGGTLAARTIPSVAVEISTDARDADTLARVLREGDPAVMGRVREGGVLLDARTVSAAEEEMLLARVVASFDR